MDKTRDHRREVVEMPWTRRWAGLDWAGLRCAALARLGWAELGWAALAGLGWAGCAGLRWAGLGWAELAKLVWVPVMPPAMPAVTWSTTNRFQQQLHAADDFG